MCCGSSRSRGGGGDPRAHDDAVCIMHTLQSSATARGADDYETIGLVLYDKRVGGEGGRSGH